MKLLSSRRKLFDLVLIEADGAATKPLKGWNSTEPVIPDFTDKTIGVLDIQTVGSIISETMVHRMEIFSQLTGGNLGEPVTIDHLYRVIVCDNGLFSQARGEEILYINKVELAVERRNVDALRARLGNKKIVAGSIQQGTIYV